MNNFDNRIPKDIAEEVLKLASYLYAQQNQESYMLGKLPTPNEEAEIPPEFIEEALKKVKEKRRQDKIRKEQVAIQQQKARQKQKRLIKIQMGALATVVITIGIACWGINTYNSLSMKHESVNTAWMDLDKKLQERADLIPYIVKVTQTYAPEYEDVITQLNEARETYLEAEDIYEKLEASTEINQAIEKFGVNVLEYEEFVVYYPRGYNRYDPNVLNHNRNSKLRQKVEAFDKLITDVQRSNNTCQKAISQYNQTVDSYNEQITSFPNLIIAIMTGLEPEISIMTYNL